MCVFVLKTEFHYESDLSFLPVYAKKKPFLILNTTLVFRIEYTETRILREKLGKKFPHSYHLFNDSPLASYLSGGGV